MYQEGIDLSTAVHTHVPARWVPSPKEEDRLEIVHQKFCQVLLRLRIRPIHHTPRAERQRSRRGASASTASTASPQRPKGRRRGEASHSVVESLAIQTLVLTLLLCYFPPKLMLHRRCPISICCSFCCRWCCCGWCCCFCCRCFRCCWCCCTSHVHVRRARVRVAREGGFLADWMRPHYIFCPCDLRGLRTVE